MIKYSGEHIRDYIRDEILKYQRKYLKRLGARAKALAMAAICSALIIKDSELAGLMMVMWESKKKRSSCLRHSQNITL